MTTSFKMKGARPATKQTEILKEISKLVKPVPQVVSAGEGIPRCIFFDKIDKIVKYANSIHPSNPGACEKTAQLLDFVEYIKENKGFCLDDHLLCARCKKHYLGDD